MTQKVLIVEHPCIVTITMDEGDIAVQIETKPVSQARRLHDSLIGPNRPFASQKDLIHALLEEEEFSENKPYSMKITVSQWLTGGKSITDRTLHVIARAYRKRTGRVLDF
jgi:hypothetical protein